MAQQSMRPARTLIVFGAVLALAFLLIGLNNAWKPELGLDLRGGLRLTGTAQGLPGADGKPVAVTASTLTTARNIIDTRVNGSGVSGAHVTTDTSSNKIEVSIPGSGVSQSDLATEVFKPAQLRFRFVACPSDAASSPCSQLSAAAPSTGLKRAPFAAPAATTSATPSASPSATPAAPKHDSTKVVPVKEAAADMANPMGAPTTVLALYANTVCTPNPDGSYDKSVGADLPGDWLVSCATGTAQNGSTYPIKYLLTPAMIEGTDISKADAGTASKGVGWSVTLNFNGHGSGIFADATGTIAGTGQQFAVVVDGVVQSAPTASERIAGQAEITGGGNGGMTQTEAQGLANNLKYGALPLEFPPSGQSTQYIGPSLAGQQLTTGLWAGAIGLLLVCLFALFYYRGLGLVVIGSLFAAGAATYSLVALLSKSAGVTLDLPGIAGLIVAVGITADSFIVYFERIRDEMRDGKSMRVAVDAAWTRARRTCLAADSVSLLAAATLYFFASNDVKGFAFMLGLSTLIDLVVFFYFTHPLVKLLSLRRFFNRGHKLSGLDAQTLGVRAITVGGKS